MGDWQLITAPTKNWRFSASYDSFVVEQTLVPRMKFSCKNRQLLVAAKRQRFLCFLLINSNASFQNLDSGCFLKAESVKS